MPIRTASLTNQIQKNGARLHLARVTRIRSQGADQPASEAEQSLLEERRRLKETNATMHARPRAPKATLIKPLLLTNSGDGLAVS